MRKIEVAINAGRLNSSSTPKCMKRQQFYDKINLPTGRPRQSAPVEKPPLFPEAIY